MDIVKVFGKNLKKYRTTLGISQEKFAELCGLHALVAWFNDTMHNIFDFCFSKGLARNPEDWADIVWYRNELLENNVDEMLNISDLSGSLPRNAAYGMRTGGSTIQMPFGFVQWHSPTKKIPGNMQFHHSYKKLAELYANIRDD